MRLTQNQVKFKIKNNSVYAVMNLCEPLWFILV